MGRPKLYEDRTKYINDWIADNYDRFNFKLNKGEKPVIQGFARYEHISTNEFIRRAVLNYQAEIYKEAGKDGQAEIDALVAKCEKRHWEKEEAKARARAAKAAEQEKADQ